MREVKGDIWKFYEAGNWICITTNGTVRKDGCAVMGRGVALDASMKIPGLQRALGQRLLSYGNKVHVFEHSRIVTFPVKHNWYDKQADLALIRVSAAELLRRWKYKISPSPIYLPRPGCGNGRLRWDDVRTVIAPILGKDFCVVQYE